VWNALLRAASAERISRSVPMRRHCHGCSERGFGSAMVGWWEREY
jgi:hypothetical protein